LIIFWRGDTGLFLIAIVFFFITPMGTTVPIDYGTNGALGIFTVMASIIRW
jgi:hypothetical protein